jgi:hypothetical protein
VRWPLDVDPALIIAISDEKLPGISLAYDKSIPQTAICFQWREA